VDSTVSKNLVELTQIDSKLHAVVSERVNLEKEKSALEEQLEDLRLKVGELESHYEAGAGRQSAEENRLKDEQEKIVQRRKQLTTIGGAKSAKLIEREIDIASKQIEMMEQRAMKALVEVDQLGEQLDTLKSRLEELESTYETRGGEIDSVVKDLKKEESSIEKDRAKVANNLEDRIVRLYDRVRKRYPADAVAIAEDGACQSCFRALPPQTYNQILAGYMMISCPGCSRILVNSDLLE